MPGVKRKWIWKPVSARRGEVNYSLVDRFTIVHFGIGVFYGLVGFSFSTALVLALTWEFIENPLKANLSFLFPHSSADTVSNMVGDVLALVAGWLIVYRFRSF